MNCRFRNNIRVQTVAKIDRIDVITVSFKVSLESKYDNAYSIQQPRIKTDAYRMS